MEELKSDFHLHCQGDPIDYFINYSDMDLTNHLYRKGYKVFSITNHEQVKSRPHIESFAKKKGMVYIEGSELTVEGCHVLILNPPSWIRGTPSFDDCYKAKEEGSVFIAPHPYYPFAKGLHHKLEEHIKLFDGVEFCHAYTKLLSFNRPAVKIAKKYDLPLFGNSDAHFLWQIGTNYTLLESELNKESILESIRQKRTKLKTTPLSTIKLARIVWELAIKPRG